jgi:hypothetical protein
MGDRKPCVSLALHTQPSSSFELIMGTAGDCETRRAFSIWARRPPVHAVGLYLKTLRRWVMTPIFSKTLASFRPRRGAATRRVLISPAAIIDQ